MDQRLLRELIPQVIGVLVRRGADFASAEDAVQAALLSALDAWRDEVPRDPKAWLVTAAWRRFVDQVRSEDARRAREDAVSLEPPAGDAPEADDTLQLFFLCAHPSLTEASAIALTLRAVGGLTTRQIAEAYLVPEATMAQRISRAKRTLADVRLDRPADPATVLRVLYLLFNEGYSGEVDLAEEAIRLTRQLAALTDEPEVHGVLALMLLHHARRASRTGPHGRLVPLAEQDRSRWDTNVIAEGVEILQTALGRDRLGEYQAQAAIAALHADAPRMQDTDWVQIVEWYDELLALSDSPVARLNRAVAVGEADGAAAGLAALHGLDPGLPRYEAVTAHLHEKAGDRPQAATAYAEAARRATSIAERDHLARQAARLRADAAVADLEALVRRCPWLVDVLTLVRDVGADFGVSCWVGAGAVRNLVWDTRYAVDAPRDPADYDGSAVRDVDVVFFDATRADPAFEDAMEAALADRRPDVSWDVANQARVHRWYEDRFGVAVDPLTSVADGVGTWPETATAVAITATATDELDVIAPFGLGDLLDGIYRHNPRRASLDDHRRRIARLRPADRWPGVTIEHR